MTLICELPEVIYKPLDVTVCEKCTEEGKLSCDLLSVGSILPTISS